VDTWHLSYDSWNPEQQGLREALCTLGNGYFSTRGAAVEAEASWPHYPGTYLAGGYNRLRTEVKGRVIENEDLVNWPNWLCLNFRPEGGEWLDIGNVTLLSFAQELDMRRGVLVRRIRIRDATGRETTLAVRRLVHMVEPHLAAIRWEMVPENWSGRLEIRSTLDGTVRNRGVKRYEGLSNQHLEFIEAGRAGTDVIYLAVQTCQSRIRMVQAARTLVFLNEQPLKAERSTVEVSGLVSQTIQLACKQGRPLGVEKVVAIYTSRDRAISEPGLAARLAVQRAGSFQVLAESHERRWAHLWHWCDVKLEGCEREQLVVRLHIFHLLQTVSVHTIDQDAGVPARGLHGEAYRGHIFWDELYIFPLLNLSMPELTRALLMYRFRRLPAAREAARRAGFEGAMYPWQSGSDGREENQIIHLNPRSGRWLPDHTHLQRHVNAAIAFNVWQYYQATEDREFLSHFGAVMILEIAKFWASACVLNPERGRYEIRGVVGPDEYHTAYPGASEPGIDNNAYTNVMAAWVLRCAGHVLDLQSEARRAELQEDLGISAEDLDHWDQIRRRIFVPFHGDGIISQFEGYEKLEPFDWEGCSKRHGDIQRLDRILEAENDTPNRYQAGKQADVLMLFYLLSAEELVEILGEMGYSLDPQSIPKIVRYYLERTSNGSSLSRVVNAWVLARTDRESSWRSFEQALRSDVDDIQGGTTSEGIHLGAMAGTTDLIQRCYLGVEMRDEVLWLNPRLPRELSGASLRLRYRGHWIALHATRERLTVTLEKGWTRTARIGFGRRIFVCKEGDVKSFDIGPSPFPMRSFEIGASP
jgi:trehalose/maltose hydrolase-like predicted phosphorylase